MRSSKKVSRENQKLSFAAEEDFNYIRSKFIGGSKLGEEFLPGIKKGIKSFPLPTLPQNLFKTNVSQVTRRLKTSNDSKKNMELYSTTDLWQISAAQVRVDYQWLR